MPNWTLLLPKKLPSFANNQRENHENSWLKERRAPGFNGPIPIFLIIQTLSFFDDITCV